MDKRLCARIWDHSRSQCDAYHGGVFAGRVLYFMGRFVYPVSDCRFLVHSKNVA